MNYQTLLNSIKEKPKTIISLGIKNTGANMNPSMFPGEASRIPVVLIEGVIYQVDLQGNLKILKDQGVFTVLNGKTGKEEFLKKTKENGIEVSHLTLGDTFPIEDFS